MKNSFTILLVFFCLDSFCQSAQWSTGDENSISSYEVQQSKDTINWTTIATVQKGKSNYAYTLPSIANYYRIKAAGVKNFYTKPILLKVSSSNSSTITNGKISTSWWNDKLSWTSSNEFNLNYYLIEKSTSAGYWGQVTQVKAKGNSNYSYTNSRGWFSKKPSYRITAVYFDGKKGIITNF